MALCQDQKRLLQGRNEAAQTKEVRAQGLAWPFAMTGEQDNMSFWLDTRGLAKYMRTIYEDWREVKQRQFSAWHATINAACANNTKFVSHNDLKPFR